MLSVYLDLRKTISGRNWPLKGSSMSHLGLLCIAKQLSRWMLCAFLILSMCAKSIQRYKLFVPKAVSLLLPSWLKSNWNNTAFWIYVGILRYINFVLILCSKVNFILLGCIQGVLFDLLYVASWLLLITMLSVGNIWSFYIFSISSVFPCRKYIWRSVSDI